MVQADYITLVSYFKSTDLEYWLKLENLLIAAPRLASALIAREEDLGVIFKTVSIKRYKTAPRRQ